MSKVVVVVDTNVAIVTNGRNTHADIACQVACIEKLNIITHKDVVALDDHDLIFDEYRRYLNFSGEPGVGDIFFKHVFNHQYSDNRVKRISISLSSDESRGFYELPRNSLDPSDRKFLAVAVAANATIINATESDWSEHHIILNTLSVLVEQLCPQHATKCD